ncbi:P-type DNA transfer ATPase VirB11 [Caulobacter sp. KR2-114]|uniref:P-type DNA transfer ATPase VirB11 n=1 Tax=Caulobacter sp. KR2-114 TaxID=3400912 RepID=UPI003C11290C
MSRVETASYLDHYLGPIAASLARPDVTDIYINRPGELWLETLGGRIERVLEPALSEAWLWRLARQIASHAHQGISRRHPLLAASLPDGSRVQVAAPPATRGAMAFAFRRHLAASVPLEAYAPAGRDGARQDPLRQGSGGREDLRELLDRGDHAAFLAEAVRRRLNIVISGGTSAGKTTLLNSLLAEIAPHERLIFIEDTPELRLQHANSVGLVAVRGAEGEAAVTPEDLLQAALRMRPDRIMLGELRGGEAFTFLRAINTGHPGSITTLHADSPDKALTQLAMMALQAGLGIAFTDVRELVRNMVDVVVQVERRDGRRVIGDIRLG